MSNYSHKSRKISSKKKDKSAMRAKKADRKLKLKKWRGENPTAFLNCINGIF